MKMLARFYFWWSSLDETLKNYVKQRNSCQLIQFITDSVPIHPRESPSKPWFETHLHFAGPYLQVLIF